MKTSGFCCSSEMFRGWFCRQSTKPSRCRPGGRVLPGAGLLKFGQMLCWGELPQTRLAPRQLPLGGSLWRARKLCTLAENFAAMPKAPSQTGGVQARTPSVIACGDATFPKGTAFRGGGKVYGVAQRRPLGGAGERSETEGVFPLYFAFLHIFTTFLW